MTERPIVGGASTAVGPTPGYYPDPSVPGFVRYWGGAAWVPGTSRPAPREGEVLEPPRFAARQAGPAPARYMPPPVVAQAAPVVAQAPAARVEPVQAAETGPVYFDQTSAGASFTFSTAPEPEAEPIAAVEQTVAHTPTGWQVDPRAQRGLLEAEDAPRWVSWGATPDAPATPDEPGAAAAVLVPVPVPVPEPVAAVLPAVVPAALTAVLPAVVPTPPAVPAALPAPRRAVPGPVAARRPAQRAAAGMGRRLAARLVDGAVVSVVAVGAGVPLVSAVADHVQLKLEQARSSAELTGRGVQVWLVDGVVLGKLGVLLAVLVLVGVVYEVLPTARTGQTFGKRLAGVRVVGTRGDGTEPPALGRSAVRWLVGQFAVLLVVGALWPFADRGLRRGWQDRMARTRVVRA